MGRPATLKVDIVADARNAQRGINDTSSAFGRLGSIGKTAALGVAAVGAAAAVAGIKLAGSALKSAADLGETISKTDQLFGSASKSVQEFAGTAATQLGISKQAALDGAATFATFGRSAGKSGKDLASFSTKLVSTASDLASFNNASPEETIAAIGAGLRGEAEPLRRFGILLDDATLRAQAMKMGLIETTSQALTPQQKVLAAQQVILSQVGAAQGDFARTSGSLSNQQKILSAQLDNVKASIGQGLLPIATRLVTFANTNMLPAFKQLHGLFQTQVVPVLRTLAERFQTNVLPAIRAVAAFVVGTLYPALARALLPVLTTAREAFARVAAKVEENRESLMRIVTAARVVAQFLAEKVAPVVGKIAATAFEIWGRTISRVIDLVATLVDKIAAAVDKVKALARAIKDSPLGKAGGAIGALFSGPPLLHATPRLAALTDNLDPRRGLTTAGLGETLLGFSGGYSGQTPLVIDRRTVENHFHIEPIVDPVGAAQTIRRLLDQHTLRTAL